MSKSIPFNSYTFQNRAVRPFTHVLPLPTHSHMFFFQAVELGGLYYFICTCLLIFGDQRSEMEHRNTSMPLPRTPRPHLHEAHDRQTQNHTQRHVLRSLGARSSHPSVGPAHSRVVNGPSSTSEDKKTPVSWSGAIDPCRLPLRTTVNDRTAVFQGATTGEAPAPHPDDS